MAADQEKLKRISSYFKEDDKEEPEVKKQESKSTFYDDVKKFFTPTDSGKTYSNSLKAFKRKQSGE